MPTSIKTPMRLCGITVPPTDSPKQNKEVVFQQVTSQGNASVALIQSAVVAARDIVWPNGQVLDYSFFGGTERQQKKVTEVIDEWTWYANVIFKLSSPRNSEATLRITFDPSKGSWSYVGNTALQCKKTEPTINLGWILDSDITTRKERGVILHEFGHVLGLMHEHESPARSGVLRLKEREIIQYYTETQGWDEDTVRKQVLNVYSKESVSNYSRFDPASIMMYFMPASMNEGGVEIPENTSLSETDKAFAVINYPRLTPHACAPQWTPSYALTSMNVKADTITAYNKASDYVEKRDCFTRYILAQRVAEAPPPSGDEPGVQHAPHVQSSIETGLEDAEFVREITKALETMDVDSFGPQHSASAPGSSVDPVQRAIDNVKHAEMVQKGVLGLLLEIAPMVLLAPNIPPPGSTMVAHAALDPNNLTIDHPVVQFGLKTFFTKLASNPIVKDVMSTAVKFAGDKVTQLISGPEHTITVGPQHAPKDDAMRLMNAILASQYFKTAVTTMVSTAVGTVTHEEIKKRYYSHPTRSHVTPEMDEYHTRMSKVADDLWEKAGPTGSTKVLTTLENLYKKKYESSQL